MSTELLPAVAPPTSPTAADAPGPPPTLAIRPWPDSVIDALGHDPRSSYVEHFWLGILGPPTMSSDAIAAGLVDGSSPWDRAA